MVLGESHESVYDPELDDPEKVVRRVVPLNKDTLPDALLEKLYSRVIELVVLEEQESDSGEQGNRSMNVGLFILNSLHSAHVKVGIKTSSVVELFFIILQHVGSDGHFEHSSACMVVFLSDL